MWININKVRKSFNGPWLLGGYCNEVLSRNDKFGGNSINSRCSRDFWSNINYYNLLDLGYKGSKYTWSNHRKRSKGLILERLDRFFANKDWLNLYPNAIVVHLPKAHSDHNPLQLSLKPSQTIGRDKHIRLETIWCRHPDFINIIKSNWTSNDLLIKQNELTKNVLIWKIKNFGDIFKKKKIFLARLSGNKNSPHYPHCDFLQDLEAKLQLEYNTILHMENDFWKLSRGLTGLMMVMLIQVFFI